MTAITIAGNLTADPELRFTPQGKPCTDVQVAVNKRIKQPDGSWVTAPPATTAAPHGASWPSTSPSPSPKGRA